MLTPDIPNLHAADFDGFFTALWGMPPFAWQKALAARVLENGESSATDSPTAEALQDDLGMKKSPWPEVIALPTASGKTACMDIAMFALAAQAGHLDTGQAIAAPRRVFFVVDRRIIVDEANERARRLAKKLAAAEEGILKTVGDNLRRISHGETTGFQNARPLAVHALRGGMYRSEAWARNPLQPMIVASTVDQIGSRLLFRAYGRSFGTWPIYAGLVANDSLILLDEAHCAQPFLQTLQAVRKYRTWAQAPLGRSFHPVVMSATPPTGSQDVFRDRSGEGTDPGHPLGKRQLAGKPAHLRCVDKARGDRAISELSKELANVARGLLGGGRRAIVVFVNRVATARNTERLLAAPDVEVILLTGRMRAIDKDHVVARLERLNLHSDRSVERDLEKPVIVVATQTLEVGADLDFDGLVTECASLDALRQRFGRLNRMGRDIECRAAVLVRADQVEGKAADDPVYGAALAKTWGWLHEHKSEQGEVDFGIACMDRRLPNDESLAEFEAPSKDAPVMMPAHVDCWAQTGPEPCPSPEVPLFLHGPREGVPDVHVCWRADLDLSSEDSHRHALESLSLCPPSSVETLPTPIGVFKRWLAGDASEDDSTDVEGADAPNADSLEVQDGGALASRRVVRWRGAQARRENITSSPSDIRPGDVVVIPTTHPGPWNQLGDIPPTGTESIATLDVGDPAHRVARAKPILRLHPHLVDAWPDSLIAKATARSLLDDIERKYEDDPDEVVDVVGGLLTGLAGADETDRWAWLQEAAKELNDEYSTPSRLRQACQLIGPRELVLAGRRRVRTLVGEADNFSDEDDAASSGISHRNGMPVLLRTHLPGVEAFARRHAVGSGLPEKLTRAVARAGLLHDVGKADPRFQSLLRGGSPWISGELLAKSGEMPRTRAARERAREISEYPQGARHELLSVRLAEAAPTLLPEDDDLRDLVLHLVASHHGHCRPFAPVVNDAETVAAEFRLCGQRMRWCGSTGLERLDSGVADRYWRLTRRYGWWGLAWLESLLRLADWRRSEWEEAHDAEG